MATIIDALLVTLGLDATGMKKGADEADVAQKKIEQGAKSSAAAGKKRDSEASIALKKKNVEEAKVAKERETSAKRAAEGLSKVKGEVLGLIASFVGLEAIKGFGEHIIGADTQISRAAGSLGIASDKLSQWESAASNFGVSASGVEDAFRGMNKFQEDLAKGSPDAINKLKEFAVTAQSLEPGKNINFGRLTDKNLSAEERLIELSKVYQQVSLKTATALGAQFGQSEEMVRVLHQGPAAIQEMLKHAAEIRPRMKEANDESEKLSGKWNELKQRATGIGESILVGIGPALEKSLDWMTNLLGYAKDHVPETGAIFTALGVSIAAVGANSIAGLVGSLGSLTGGLGAAAAGASSLIGLLGSGGLVVAAGAAGYAVGSLANDGISWLITKLTGADATLGTFIFDLFNTNKTADEISKEAFLKGQKLKAEGGIPSQAQASSTAPNSQSSTQNSPKPQSSQSSASVADFAEMDSGGTPSTPAKPAQPGTPAAWAQAAQAKYGISSALTLAQYDLESGGGKHMPGGTGAGTSNNPFGIKARPGEPYVEAMTTEVIKGITYRIPQKFKKFDSLADAFDAHAKLLAEGKPYAKARAASHGDQREFARQISGTYATDPGYKAKLEKLIDKYSKNEGNGAQKNTDVTIKKIDPAVEKALKPGPPIDKSIQKGAAAAVASATTNNNTQTSNNSNVQTHINGPINVHTQATNADGIASDMRKSLQRYAFASNANSGLV